MVGLGLSVIDAKLEEVMYLGLLDVDISYRMTRSDYETEIKFGKLQVDNQTDKGPEIVLGVEKKEGEGEDGAPVPATLHVSMVKSRVYKDMSYFKYFAFQLRELNLDLEETFIMRLLDAAQNVVDSSTITVPEEKQDDLRGSGYKRLRFLRKEALLGEKMYFELLQLHPIQVNLSFFVCVCMCACVCIHVYIHVYIYMYIYICIYIYIYMHTYIYTCTCMCVYIHKMYICTCTYIDRSISPSS